MQTIKNIFFKLPILKINFNFYFLINNILKNIFLPKTIKHYNSIGKPYGIIISDTMLKFHNGDIRKEVSKKLLK